MPPKYQVLSQAEKKTIQDAVLEDREKPKAQQLKQQAWAQHFTAVMGKPVSKDVVSRIMLGPRIQGGADKKRLKAGANEDLEAMLYHWFVQSRANHLTITDREIVAKAIALSQQQPQLNSRGIDFSLGWARRFRERYNIVSARTYGEAASANPQAVAEARTLIQSWLESYHPDDIFNEDETGLFYNLEPNRTLIIANEKKSLRGVKKQKERLTVAVCTNMTGSIKLKPYCIGKSANPRAFKGFQRDKFIRWNNNATAWMNGDTFRDYITWFDNEMLRYGKKKVLLVMDNAPTHQLVGIRLQRTQVVFFPANVTSIVQPMDAGIIRAFKQRYRAKYIQHRVTQFEN